MSSEFDYENRQLIPRLLPFHTANVLSLNHWSSEPEYMNSFENHNFLRLLTEWNSGEKNIATGISIISYKVFFESIEIPEDVDGFLKKNVKYLTQSQTELYNLYRRKALLENPVCGEAIDVYKEIHDIRNTNKVNNRNPIVWCDLGYFYTSLGLIKQATRCFLIALGLNANNRHVVRSVSRFFLHIDEPGKALNILRSSPNIRNDAGLLSAEIAISELEGRKSKFIDYGKRKVNDENVSVLEKNELLAQFATLEFNYGKNRLGREYVEKCLTRPNENSLAQFEFLSNNFSIDGEFSSHEFNVPCKHEALARYYHIRNDYEGAFNEANLWIDFQPFSSQPACYGSYIASTILENHKKSILILDKALRIAPQDFTLLNNYAFALASMNREKEAIEKISRIDLKQMDQSEQAVFNATLGLIKIKTGDVENGKKLYEKSIDYFRKSKDLAALARAKYHFGRALNDIESERSGILISEAFQMAKKNNLPDLVYVIDKVLKAKEST